MTQSSTPRRPNLWTVFFTATIDLVGYGALLVLLPTYSREFGGSGLDLGLLLGTAPAANIIFSPIFARISDRVGRRPVLLFSITMTALGMFVMGLSTSLAMLLVARLIGGLGAGRIALIRAYAADITSSEDRARGIGIVSAARAMAVVIGPSLGGLLSGYGGLSLAGFLLAGLAIFNLLLVVVLMPEPPRVARKPDVQGHSAVRAMLLRPDIQIGLGLSFCAFFAVGCFGQVFVLFLTEGLEYSLREVGYLFMFQGALMAILQGVLIGWLNRRFGPTRLLWFGISTFVIGMAMIPRAEGLAALLALISLQAIGGALYRNTSTTILSRQSAHGAQGVTMGIQESVIAAAQIIGSVAAGLAYDEVSSVAPFYLGAAVGAIGLVLVPLLLAKVPRYADSE